MSFKRSKPPEVPQLPPQPTPVELMDIIDEVSGVQTITTTGPDGKKRRITQRLPLTPQEQAILSQAENLMAKAVNNIESLYQYDPNSVANYQPFIQAFSDINEERATDLAQIGNFIDIGQKVEAFRNINRELTNREFDRQQRIGEESLAKRGLQRSTMATEQRAAMANERALAEQQADINANLYGEDLMQRQLARESQVYGLRETGRQGRLQQAELGYNLERQKLEDAERLRQQAIAENMNWLNVGQGIKAAEQDKAKLALMGNQVANQMYQAQASNQNQRFQNEMSRIQNQYGMDLARFNATPAKFGEKLTDLGLGIAGMYAGSKIPGFGATTTAGNIQPTQFGSSYGRNQAFNQLQLLGRR